MLQVAAEGYDDYQMHSHPRPEATNCKAWQQVDNRCFWLGLPIPAEADCLRKLAEPHCDEDGTQPIL